MVSHGKVVMWCVFPSVEQSSFYKAESQSADFEETHYRKCTQKWCYFLQLY